MTVNASGGSRASMRSLQIHAHLYLATRSDAERSVASFLQPHSHIHVQHKRSPTNGLADAAHGRASAAQHRKCGNGLGTTADVRRQEGRLVLNLSCRRPFAARPSCRRLLHRDVRMGRSAWMRASRLMPHGRHFVPIACFNSVPDRYTTAPAASSVRHSHPPPTHVALHERRVSARVSSSHIPRVQQCSQRPTFRSSSVRSHCSSR